MDRERVQEKLGFIKQQVSEVRQLVATRGAGEVTSDPWLMKGLKYSLQVAIEAMIDVAYHIAAKGYECAPRDARDAFEILAQKGAVGQEDLPVFLEMVRFRNRLVHGYNKVNDAVVYYAAENKLQDFDRFVKSIGGCLQAGGRDA
ncbi:MAG: DUF86 domain-containing protein [Clostridia bacterium]|nr:MAG: DUF86 domain-containing protein [Clostridia bacterium]